MAVYILHEYPVKLPDGSKPCIMTADNEEQLHAMAKLIYVSPDKFNDQDGAMFYMISRSQMKKAVNNGAVKGDEARELIRFKKHFPYMQQRD